MRDEFWAVMDEYKETFGDAFPLFGFQDASDEEMMAVARNCIKSKKPYELDIKKDY